MEEIIAAYINSVGKAFAVKVEDPKKCWIKDNLLYVETSKGTVAFSPDGKKRDVSCPSA